MIGFGTGHYHAYGDWTGRSSMFIVPDLLITPAFIGSIALIAKKNPWGVAMLFPTAALKALQGIYAANEAQRVNEGAGNYPRPDERFVDAAATLGGLTGFGLGHIYAEKRLTWRALAFAIADIATLSILLSATGRGVTNINSYVWALEGVRLIEAIDAGVLANNRNAATAALQRLSRHEGRLFSITLLEYTF